MGAFDGLSNFVRSKWSGYDVNAQKKKDEETKRRTEATIRRAYQSKGTPQAKRQLLGRAVENERDKSWTRLDNGVYVQPKSQNNLSAIANAAATQVVYNNPLSPKGWANMYNSGREAIGTWTGNRGMREAGTRGLAERRAVESFNNAQAMDQKANFAGNAIGGVVNAGTQPFKIPSGRMTTPTLIAQAIPRYGLPTAADTGHAIREGGGSETAQKLGSASTGLVSTAMGAFGLGRMGQPNAGSMAGKQTLGQIGRNIAISGNAEGMEELVEGGVDDAVARATYDKDRSWGQTAQNLFTAYTAGAVSGGVLGGANARYGGETGKQQAKEDKQTINNEINLRKVTENKNKQIARRDIITRQKAEANRTGNKREYARLTKVEADLNDSIENLEKREKFLGTNLGLSMKLTNDEELNAQSDPLESLKQEARKYKSAEEFVKAQGEPVYHGTTEKIDGDFKYPLYTTPKKDYAQVFADSTAASSIGKSGKKLSDAPMVHEFAVNPKARVLDITNPEHRKLLEEQYFGKYSMSYDPVLGKNGHMDWTEGENLAEWIDENKLPFDAIKLDEGGGGIDPSSGLPVIDKGVSFMALNDKAVRSKQQLTDLYTQATAPKTEGVAPKSALVVKTAPRTQLSGKALDVPSEQIGKALGLTDEQMADSSQKASVLDAFPKAREVAQQTTKTQQNTTQPPQKNPSPQSEAYRLGSPFQSDSSQQNVRTSSTSGKQDTSVTGKQSVSSDNIIADMENEVIGHPTYDVKKKVSILDKIRTPEKVLRKIGLGDVADKLKRADIKYKQELPQEIDKITKWYERVGKSDEASTRIFKYLDGQRGAKSKLQGNELDVANEVKVYLKNWAEKLNLPEDGRITNYITHIFDEQLVSKEFDPELEKLIADKVPGSVYDPFTLQRLGAKGYVEDTFRALDAYVKRGTRKMNMDPILAELSDRANELDKSGLDYVKEYADRINMRPTDLDNSIDIMVKQAIGYKLGQRPTAKVTRAIRQATYRATLGLNVGSAVRNLTQGINTFAEMGGEYTLKGYYNMVKNWNSGELQKVGVLDNSFIEDRTLSATKKAGEKMDKVLFAMFEGAEKVNRGAAYYAAKQRAIDKGATLEQAIQAGIDTAAKTQFTFGRVNTPLYLQSDMSKLFFQFQSFNVKQTEFLVEMAANKEYAKLLRFAGASALVFALLSKALGYELEDMVPFGSNIKDGKIPIGAAPVFRVLPEAVDFTKAVFTTPSEDAKNTKQENVKEASKDLGAAIGSTTIPGFVQAKKTYSGLKAVKEGEMNVYGKGNVQVEQSPKNAIKGAVFGTKALTIEEPTVKTTGKPKGIIAITDKTEKDSSGKFVTRDKYDAVINSYTKTDGGLDNIQKYDNKELSGAVKDVANEAVDYLKQVGVTSIKADSKLATLYAKYKKSEAQDPEKTFAQALLRAYPELKAEKTVSKKSSRKSGRSGGRTGTKTALKSALTLATANKPNLPAFKLGSSKAPQAKLSIPSIQTANTSTKGRQYTVKVKKLA
jgi:hypothetical protein